jgi:hypothetical protein
MLDPVLTPHVSCTDNCGWPEDNSYRLGLCPNKYFESSDRLTRLGFVLVPALMDHGSCGWPEDNSRCLMPSYFKELTE